MYQSQDKKESISWVLILHERSDEVKEFFVVSFIDKTIEKEQFTLKADF